MFGLIDCNNFYCSCERAFNPSLNNKPVIVLSNNDGCVVSRSNEAKKLGIGMAVPFYQVKDIVAKHGVHVFSSNYSLYADMSNRVMNILKDFVENMEVYSVDEAFLDFKGFDLIGLKEKGEEITNTIFRWTGLPVSLGIAPTKTLAKIANKFAKKYKKYNNVCIIDTEEKIEKALKLTEIEDVWGIGRRNGKKLISSGIKTAYDLVQLPRYTVRKKLTVTGERTWCELKGESCIHFEMVTPDKQQICTSRMFGKIQTDIESIREAISTYASLCAEKLRKQKSCACSILVFLYGKRNYEDKQLCSGSFKIKLSVPTNSTFEIVKYSLEALNKIFQKGYKYKKGGVIITEIIPEYPVQTDLFDKVDRQKHKKIMNIFDMLNSGYCKNNVSLAIQGTSKNWKHKQDMLSPCYTTRLSDVIKINCK